MYFLILFVGYFVGLATFSFTIIQLLIVLRVGVSLTRELDAKGALITPNPLLRQYSISILVLLAFFFIVTFLVHEFGSEAFVNGYYIGMIFMFFLGIRQTGRNEANVKEFIEKNKKYIKA